MIEKCTDEGKVADILHFIGENKAKEPYLYANLKHYGVFSPHVTVWTEEKNGQLCAVYLQYYDCLHFFANDYRSSESLPEMIDQLKPRVVMYPENCITGSVKKSAAEQYDIQENYVMCLSSHGGISDCVREATEEDVVGIVDLLLADKNYQNVYDRNVLYAQTKDRIMNGGGKSYILWHNGDMAATISVYVQTDDMTLLGGLLTNPKYRKMGFSQELTQHVHHIYCGKDHMAIGIVNKENIPSLAFHKKIGAVPLSTLCKLIHK